MIIKISINDDRWSCVAASSEDKVREIFEVSLSHTDFCDNQDKFEISLFFTYDYIIQKFNLRYRDKNSPTNVLSFPLFSRDEIMGGNDTMALGDIMLGYDTIEKQTQEYGISMEEHTTHLLIHGFLHLLGFDHSTQESALKMEAIEEASMIKLGYNSKYSND